MASDHNTPDSFTIGSGTAHPTFAPIDELSYEDARQELVEVVRILELGHMSLDESLMYWERGEALARRCEDYLDGARQRVEKLIVVDAQSAGGDVRGDDDSSDEFSS
ncbi:exodeoxyribonuclease VII small subunit [Corynebacterium kroppenstedtii]|uniref:exodeoxyribonuclease VII small subunit n=1 Tax=Corynebacterium sp. PCR 32 TaxID=3351342 RepID=UPI0030AB888C